MQYMFLNCTNLTDISALANWNVSNVTTMQSMFNMNGVSNPQLSDITAYFSHALFLQLIQQHIG